MNKIEQKVTEMIHELDWSDARDYISNFESISEAGQEVYWQETGKLDYKLQLSKADINHIEDCLEKNYIDEHMFFNGAFNKLTYWSLSNIFLFDEDKVPMFYIDEEEDGDVYFHLLDVVNDTLYNRERIFSAKYYVAEHITNPNANMGLYLICSISGNEMMSSVDKFVSEDTL